MDFRILAILSRQLSIRMSVIGKGNNVKWKFKDAKSIVSSKVYSCVIHIHQFTKVDVIIVYWKHTKNQKKSINLEQ